VAYAISGDAARWPDGVMPYVISDDFNQGQQRTVRRAIDHWNRRSIMRLIKRSNQDAFVKFVPAENACQSAVGRQGGEQHVGCAIGDGFDTGSVIHEIGHSVGYFHEQQRPDRDQFVTVNSGNIEVGKESNFEIRLGGVILGPYDYGSIMHYPRDAFVDGGDTIVAPVGVSIGQRDGLSEPDINGACAMFGAPHFVVAFEDDGNVEGRSNVVWAGLARWGKYCWRPSPVDDGDTHRSLPNVAMDADRTSVVVWQDGRTDGDIRARCRAIDGADRFGEIVVASGSGSNEAPDVAMAADGNFVVVWQRRLPGGVQEIRMRGFDRRGQERFAPVTISSGAGVPGAAAVAIGGSGTFVAVWGELIDESLAVRGRVFGLDGTRIFEQFTVAEDLGDQDVFPRVAAATGDNFVVAWERTARDVRARGFNTDTSDRFTEIGVSATDVGAQLVADLAVTPAGRFVITWTDDRNENSLGQIRARAFDAEGVEATPEFAANPRGGGDQQRARLAVDRDGRTYVVWEDDEDRNGVFQIHATAFDAAGERSLKSVTVNTRWRGQQRRPAIASR
jgi:Astacin (Peptidase family M12A)